MMTRWLPALVLLWTLVALPAAAAPAPRVLVPLDGAVVHCPDVLLVHTVPPEQATLYSINGTRVALKAVAVPGNDADLYHVRIPLTEGRNEVRLLAAADESTTATLSITYVPPYSRRTAMKRGTRPYAFHTREQEATCAGCHSIPEVFETVPDRPLAPAGKVCGACHPRVESAPHLHGPVAVYACFMCHNPDYSPARFGNKTSQAASCGTCHEGFLSKILGGKKHVHGPVATGSCLACHDPHGGKTGANIRETLPDLCLLCHADTLPLPLEKGLHAKVPCASCHDAHGGASPMMLPEAGNAFCARCHPEVADMKSGHPIAGHPVAAKVDPSKPSRTFGCHSCHEPHGLQDVSKQDILADEKAQRQFCRRCHY